MLPYDTEAFFALFQRYLDDSGNLIWIAPLLSVVGCLLLMQRGAILRRLGATLLALAWLWIGWVFHGHYFAQINFAAPVYAGLFIAEAALLLWQGALLDRIAVRWNGRITDWIAIVLAVLALIVFPLSDYLAGQPLSGVRTVGLAAAPTALLTIGILLVAVEPVPRQLVVIPFIWTCVSGFSGWVLSIPHDLLLPLPAAVGLVAMIARHRGYRRHTSQT